jgi:hypothetical protein
MLPSNEKPRVIVKLSEYSLLKVTLPSILRS